ncbi:MAG TPA: enoyl-CoA hydratase-related protein [Candidatus Xenobia bacterium]|jgi:enoyl-CoA hydratase
MVKVTIEERLGTICIDRPEARNALDKETLAGLRDALEALQDNPDVGVLCITGGGDKAFVSGADIKDLRERKAMQAVASPAQRLFTVIEKLDKPVIAAINGFALGGGCELALACDVRVASESARLGFPEVGLGIIPGAGGTQRLPRLVGWGWARELILTGQILDAPTALRIGLVTHVVPPDKLMAEVRGIADQMLSKGPLALRMAKSLLALSARTDLDSGLVAEALAQGVLFESEDKREGTTAFIEKRRPQFRGR